MSKEHSGWETKLSKPVGMILLKWLQAHSISSPASWYKKFYRRCIFKMEGFPMNLPIDWVIAEYVRGIDYGYVDLTDNRVESHEEAMRKWLWQKVGHDVRRDLLFKKHRGDLDDLDKERLTVFQFTKNHKQAKKKEAKFSRRLKVRDENQGNLL